MRVHSVVVAAALIAVCLYGSVMVAEARALRSLRGFKEPSYDRFRFAMTRFKPEWKVVSPGPTRSTSVKNCQIPRAKDMLAKGYKTVQLNTNINAGYANLADCFQSIVTGQKGASEYPKVTPMWYAFAPYASIVVGKSEIGLHAANEPIRRLKQALEDIKRAWDTNSFLDLFKKLGPFLNPLKLGEEITEIVKAIVKAMAFTGHAAINGYEAGSFEALIKDGKVIPMMVTEFMKILMPANCAASISNCCPAASDLGITKLGRLRSKLGSCISMLGSMAANLPKLPLTLEKVMEHGNRLIYSDIGGRGEEYLRWRDSVVKTLGGSPSTDEILKGFGQGKCDGTMASVRANLAAAKPPIRFKNLQDALPNQNLKRLCLSVAAFALWEEAAKETNAAKKHKMISHANDMFAWVEQYDAVQPAFTPPGGIQPGELDRSRIMKMMSPTVNLGFRFGAWTFHGYCKKKGTSSTNFNWGLFDHRWAPILDAFVAGYANKAKLWPMPGPYAGDFRV